MMEVVRGDIAKQSVDAIVNAANTSLMGGGGVDGAIHRAAGPELLEACKALGGCPTGSAKLSRGYRLPAKYVIHAVGPVWHGGTHHEEELLSNCYRISLMLAERQRIRSIAFPSISTGVYRFPIQSAAQIAVESVRSALKSAKSIQKVVFVCFSDGDYQVYKSILGGASS